MTWTVISAVNDGIVLDKCLLSSPDIRTVEQILLKRNSASASLAYNSGLDAAVGDWIALVHQDVYLPPGWVRSVESAINCIERQDRNWGVLGVWGVKATGERAGHVYCTGLQQVLGKPFEGGIEVSSVDELLIIVRRSAGLRFDERLPGFHMYGTDICLEAKARNMRSYAIGVLCVHNTNGYRVLPLAFWLSCLYIRSKWKAQLPLRTPCIDITQGCWPMIHRNIIQVANIALGRCKPGTRVARPDVLYKRLIKQ